MPKSSKKDWDKASAKKLSVVEGGVLDPLRIADMQRRGCYHSSDKKRVDDVCDRMYRLGANWSNLGTELPLNHPVHKPYIDRLKTDFYDLAMQAKLAGAVKILFPFPDNTPWARFARKILREARIDFPFEFRNRKSPYSLDLSEYGKIDRTVKNILSVDPKTSITLRGFWEIDVKTKRRWDIETNPRYSAAVRRQEFALLNEG